MHLLHFIQDFSHAKICLFALSPQKNPQAIRMAEERRGLEQMAMTAAVNLSRAWQLSSHVRNMCSEAHEAIYTREADVKYWLEKGNLILLYH